MKKDFAMYAGLGICIVSLIAIAVTIFHANYVIASVETERQLVFENWRVAAEEALPQIRGEAAVQAYLDIHEDAVPAPTVAEAEATLAALRGLEAIRAYKRIGEAKRDRGLQQIGANLAALHEEPADWSAVQATAIPIATIATTDLDPAWSGGTDNGARLIKVGGESYFALRAPDCPSEGRVTVYEFKDDGRSRHFIAAAPGQLAAAAK